MKMGLKTTNKAIIILVIVWSTLFLFPSLSFKQVESNISEKEIIFNDFKFNDTYVYDLIKKQVDLGPRYPGSEGIENARHLITSELNQTKWKIVFQNFTKVWNNENVTVVNIICEPRSRNHSEQAFLLLAHYDSRLWADQDPNSQKRKDPVPGANDGASGVAIAIELGRVLLEYYNSTNFQLVFFDAEDQGTINVPNEWPWLVGSRYYANSQMFLNENLSFGILLDMVAAEGAVFKRESYSWNNAKELVSWIWNEAHSLNFQNYFVNTSFFGPILDDHVPLLEKGLPTIDIIDEFGTRFTQWHTTSDNMTFIDTETIKAVGFTLESALSGLINETEFLSNLPSVNFQSPILLNSSINLILLWALKRTYTRKKRFP